MASYSAPGVRKSREICDLTRSSPQRYGSECKIRACLFANSRGSQEKQVHPNTGKLTWKDAGDGERAGRMQLFKGSYLAYRNRRAHREPKGTAEKALMEFLLLNRLYILEKESTEVSSS